MKKIRNISIPLLILWLLLVPPSIIYLYIHFQTVEIDVLYYITLLILGLLTVLITVKRNGKPVKLYIWISVTTFLLYGIVAEIILTQIVLLSHFYSSRKDEKVVNHVLQRSIALIIVSIAAAAMFFAVGGEVGSLNFWVLFLGIIAYQLTRRTLIFISSRFIFLDKGMKELHIKDAILFEFAIIFLVLPFTMSLYYLIHFVGYGAFLLLAIPYFFIIIVLRMYDKKEKVNDYLKMADKVGHQISNLFTEDEVIDKFIEEVSKMFQADRVYLLENHDEWLETLRFYKDGKKHPVQQNRITLNYEFFQEILKNQKSLIFHNKLAWEQKIEHAEWIPVESMFAVPILRDQRVEGILIVSSKKKKQYKNLQVQLAEILSSYFAVSVEKARNIEHTVKQIDYCALTKLYNYNYILNFLLNENERFLRKETKKLSVIMIDIDHFKEINDSYGHESGNDILSELGAILREEVPTGGIAARYGGEEFVYILPDMDKDEAYHIAENLRRLIEKKVFTIIPDLGRMSQSEEIKVSITVSMGVSGIPDDTDDVSTLIRNADRALYIGAKQTGRNRVARYVK